MVSFFKLMLAAGRYLIGTCYAIST